MAELGEMKHQAEAAAQEEDFFIKIKEEVLDKYNSNFVDLQDQLKTLKSLNNNFQAQQQQTSQQLSDQLTETNYTVKQYQILVDEFKKDIRNKIVNQQVEIKQEVMKTIDDHISKQK